MKNNLTARTVIIVVTILVCVFGIIGIPKSGADISKNFSDNIRLGLDLKGGTHLVLEIQVQDAVKADADQTAERLKEDLKKQNIQWNSMDTPDVAKVEDADNVAITIKGVPATQSSAFRSLVGERYSNYILTATSSTDYTMKLKPTDLQELKVDTVKRAVDTIGNRIDQLGLAEKSVQQYGEAGKKYEVLVQLPGVDDPARAKELIGTAAVLEIVDVKEGPFPSREAALSQKGGILPLGTKLARSKPRGTQDGEQWYLVSKNAVISGREMRNARAGQDEFRKWETNFTLSQDGGRRFGRYTEANIGNKLGVLLDNQLVSVATIQSKIEDSGRITGLGSEEESVDLSRYLRSGSLPAGVQYLQER
ncbi:MAG: protein-export rane protein SecD, partial [Candidatus Solibacter sp.]|nr:protein-export rane protein SecD [Candidatus Solibacter sp.]